MIVELTSTQRTLLLRLVNEALDEIGPEIRHTTMRDYKADLRDERLRLRQLHDLLADVNELEAADHTRA